MIPGSIEIKKITRVQRTWTGHDEWTGKWAFEVAVEIEPKGDGPTIAFDLDVEAASYKEVPEMTRVIVQQWAFALAKLVDASGHLD